MSLLSPSQDRIAQRAGGLETAGTTRSTWLDGWCRRQVLARLAQLQGGEVKLLEPDLPLALAVPPTPSGSSNSDSTHSDSNGQPLEAHPLAAELYVRHPRFYRRVALGGSMGAAEAYMAGDWAADDLPTLLQVFARDWSVACELDLGWRTAFKKSAGRSWAWLRRNTPSGSHKNISAHYDLSNDFYRLWLDETMAYSAAIFPDAKATLHDASQHKFDLICQKLELQPNDHLLEIGTGWGGFALHAAKNYGCRVTTTTISRQQYDYAQDLFAKHGLTERIQLLDQDYRSLSGQYNKLVSIEMIEAVGHEYLPTYFAKCNALLEHGGRMVLQAITIPDQRYEGYRRSIDFIQRYIFPGGALPSLGAIQRAVGAQTTLLLTGLQDYGLDYARTLAAWRERFFDQLHQVRRLGFDEQFIRTWDYYLSYCMAGFRERQIGLAQLVFEKQG